MRTEKESSPQISGDMVSLHNMVSPQNGDTRGGPPPSFAKSVLYHWYVQRYQKPNFVLLKAVIQEISCNGSPSPPLLQATVKLFLFLKVKKKTVKTSTVFNGRNFFRACYCILIIAFCVTYRFTVFNSYVCSFNFADFLHQIATEDFRYWGQN